MVTVGLIGDGRFLRVGVLAPLATTTGIHVLAIESGLVGAPDSAHVARALRRAVMARVQAELGNEPLPAFFSGHEPDGGPVRAEKSSHLAFLCDLPRSRLIVAAPHMLDQRDATRDERKHLTLLDDALNGMNELRAGKSGLLTLRPARIDTDSDPLTALSRVWDNTTPYVVTRHAKKIGATEALAADLRAECYRIGLPKPHVSTRDVVGVPGIGLVGAARLEFEIAVRGPIVLGRTRFLGGGLFAARS